MPSTDDKTIKEDVIYEAAVLIRLGDHPNLSLLFGVCTAEKPYKLITLFDGEENSLTLNNAIKKLSPKELALILNIKLGVYTMM